MKNKLKLATLTFAAFSAGCTIQFLIDRKDHRDILKKETRLKYFDGFEKGWTSALNDVPSIKLAHSRMTRLMTPEYSPN